MRAVIDEPCYRSSTRRKKPRRMLKSTQPLSRRLEAAFARLDPATPVPPWPRAVRVGVDYSLRVTGMNPATDREADSIAYACFVLGNLAKRDPPGDPPASVPAQEAAERVGPDHARAFAALDMIRDSSAILAAAGLAVPALSPEAMRRLQRMARGAGRPDTEALAAAEALADQLGGLVLIRRPGGANFRPGFWGLGAQPIRSAADQPAREDRRRR